jgi:xanthine dehydrogenase small subunit
MHKSINFLLGNEKRSLTDISPTTTVLEYLRNDECRMGTKEGCGEGDCGACTVVVGEPVDGKIQYRAINACIQFLPTIDGCQLLTVEDLQAPDGQLHPVQQAMVDCHGSQCGFCTPGFVMSLYSLYRQGGDVSRARINDTLAGNLCRCTGYGTIAAAAGNMGKIDGPDHPHEYEADAISHLESMRNAGMLQLSFGTQNYYAPTSADELADTYLQNPQAIILSGGTDVGLWVTKLGRHLDTIIYTGKVSELRKVEQIDGNIIVWAGVTQGDLLPEIASHYPDFAELLRRFGSTQIRNSSTLCGNVANGSPIGDSPPALIALDARVTLRRGSERRELPVEDFFLDYGKQDRAAGEFVEKVTIPQAEPGKIFHAYKLSKRFDQDISAVCGAFRLELDGGRVTDLRIAFGGLAAIPKRASNVESILIGNVWTEATIRAAMDLMSADFQPVSDMRASEEYRMQSAKNLLLKFYLETTNHASQTLRLVG